MIDILKISDEIRNKHKQFIETYGFQLDKLGADHRLYTQQLTTKLSKLRSGIQVSLIRFGPNQVWFGHEGGLGSVWYEFEADRCRLGSDSNLQMKIREGGIGFEVCG